MRRLLVILGSCYVISLVALLAIRVVPGIPWQILIGFVFQFIPLALTLTWLLTRIEDRLAPPGANKLASWTQSTLIAVGGIGLGTLLVWFFDKTDPIPVRIGLSAFAIWQLVVGPAKAFVKPL